jgi:hypothetical protein
MASLGRDLEVMAVPVARWTSVQVLLDGRVAPESPR